MLGVITRFTGQWCFVYIAVLVRHRCSVTDARAPLTLQGSEAIYGKAFLMSYLCVPTYWILYPDTHGFKFDFRLR